MEIVYIVLTNIEKRNVEIKWVDTIGLENGINNIKEGYKKE